MISPRNKKKFPLRAPRILIIRPPGLKNYAKKIASSISELLDLNKIEISTLIENEIKKKSEIGKFSYKKLENFESSN